MKVQKKTITIYIPKSSLSYKLYHKYTKLFISCTLIGLEDYLKIFYKINEIIFIHSFRSGFAYLIFIIWF